LAQKKVYFHKLNYYERAFVKDAKLADTEKKKYKSEKLFSLELKRILSKHVTANCLKLEEGSSQITLEVISETKEFLFARLGKLQDIKTVHLRNKKTLKASPIHKAIDQEIEIFTYLLLDKTNMVCSYIREQGAPHIKKLENIVSRYRTNENMFLDVDPIVVDDTLELLKKKDKIGKIDYQVSLPIDELLDKDHLDLPVDDFIKLKNMKSAKIQITLTGQTNTSIVENISENIGKVVKRVMGNKLGTTEKFTITGKKESEYVQDHNMFDDIFVRKTNINMKSIDSKIKKLDHTKDDYYEKVEQIVFDQIKSKLLEVYRVNKGELSNYIRLSDE
jgi:hypothetical protein